MDKDYIMNHGNDGLVSYNGSCHILQKVEFCKSENAVYAHLIPKNGGLIMYAKVHSATYDDRDEFLLSRKWQIIPGSIDLDTLAMSK